MNSRSKYKTRHRELILEYLESDTDGHFTAADVYEYFRSSENPIGQATVYRQLESLVDEGVINKYIIDANSPACFEYVGAASHHSETCYHCKCEKCGRLIHLHCEELEAFQAHLYAEHHFRLDPRRTVLYGLCDECLND